MNILFNKSNFVLAASLLITTAALAQQGVGTDTPEKSSVLELKSTKRGLLVPRIALTKTNVEAPVHLPANSLLVYNTNTTTGANKVEPGYYYWSQDDSSWMRIINQKDIDTAISNIGDTKVTSAELSGTTLKIKQNGVVTDISVDLASLVKTYTGDNTSIKIDGTTVKRMALTGDVKADEGSGVVTVERLRGRNISITPPTAGQVLQWDGYNWKPVNMPIVKNYSGSNSIIFDSNTTSFKRAALTGDVTASENINDVTVRKIQGREVSSSAPVNGQVLKWDGSKWAPAEDTSSKETVEGTGVVTVTGSGSAGESNRSFTVGITPAGGTETKVLQSVNGTVKWADAPSTASLNTIGGTAKVVTDIEISTWGNPGDVFLCVTTTKNDIDLPDPAQYVGRIISVNNQANRAANYASNSPANRSALYSGMGHLLMSVGVQEGGSTTYKWYIIGGSY